MAEIVVVGEILAEFVGTGDARLDRESLFAGPYPSGAPAIAADQAALQGAATAMVGVVGRDRFGEMCRDRLARDGVDVSRVRIDPVAPTATAHVAYHATGGRDFVFTLKHSAATSLGPDDVDAALFTGSRFLLISGSTLYGLDAVAAVHRAVSLARAAGATFAIDLNVREQLLDAAGFATLAGLVDAAGVLLAGHEDLAAMARHGRPVDPAAFAASGRLALVKRGAEGATLLSGGDVVEEPAIPSVETDPTGAGDAFAATFLAATVRGAAPRDALRRASAAGALAVRKRGPMSGNSTIAEVDALLAGR